ncbi:unnamed protein product [Pedinophyceae sp. YPF-701]|nr:unnamed protein product [Pedinophyceae sp. YPF-701]
MAAPLPTKQSTRSKLSPENQPLFDVFTTYTNGSGRSKDPTQMDGRTWVKVCKDAGAVGKSITTTDLDLIFAKVKSGPSAKTISFNEFMEGLRQLIDRSKGALGTVDDLRKAILKASMKGPSYVGTVPEAVRFHDDKSLYTGVHKNGGPTNVDIGTSDLKHITNRAAADVRGVQL